MKQEICKILSNTPIADHTYSLCLEGDGRAFERGGQFADIALDGHFLRRPFAVQKWDGKSFTLIYKVVGEGTKQLAAMTAGVLDVLTGLGNGFDASMCRESALVVCGGLGASPVFTLVKDLLGQGKKVTVVLGFNTATEVILEEEYRQIGAEVITVTLDGSAGKKGLVTDWLPESGYDVFYTCGPKVMMKAVCQKLDIHGQASLEERMGCGCGICYGCTCHTAKGPKRVCADGPVFNKEDIIW